MIGEKEIRFIDLFGGIGGFRLGLERASPRFRCVWYNDINKYSVRIYNKNFTENHEARDIKGISVKEIPEHELLCAGFPCQAFSIAGKRLGFKDTRGTLFFEIAKIIKGRQPCFILLENVEGLLSHDKGRTFGVVLATLDELGYNAEWQVLNSKYFGVPQVRSRIFILGHNRKFRECSWQVFPLRGNGEKVDKEGAIVRTLTGGGHSGGLHSQMTAIMDFRNDEGFRIRKELLSPTLTSRRHSERRHSETDISTMPPLIISTLTPDRLRKGQHGRRFKSNKEPMFTLTKQDIHGIFDGVKIRRLMPVECERLQGFPDGWTDGVSDTQRYRMLGDAVTVNVIEAIGRKISENYA